MDTPLLARRNLNDYNRIKVASALEETIREQAREKEQENGKRQGGDRKSEEYKNRSLLNLTNSDFQPTADKQTPDTQEVQQLRDAVNTAPLARAAGPTAPQQEGQHDELEADVPIQEVVVPKKRIDTRVFSPCQDQQPMRRTHNPHTIFTVVRYLP